ncbi:MAG: formylglycine-generating enzyme family protein [Rubripirellula sp.]|nr:formylglycine-generating enzyme family protein [Rubripirellula sp.]
MADIDFDPYYKWLGIPPPEQPPNKYRLLGITIFESDPEVIEAAVQRQISHVRTYSLGPHAERSQELLRELVAARVTLLDLQLKSKYDRELRHCTSREETAGMKGTGALGRMLKTAASSGGESEERRMKLSLLSIGLGVIVIGAFLVALLFLLFIFPREVGEESTGLVASASLPVQAAEDPVQAAEDPVQAAEDPVQAAEVPVQAIRLPEKTGLVQPVEGISESLDELLSGFELSEIEFLSLEQSQQAATPDESDLIPGKTDSTSPLNVQVESSSRHAWAERMGVPFEIVNSIGMQFKPIPAGVLKRMVGKEAWAISITKPYEIGIHEVTQSQYVEVMGLNPSGFNGTGRPVDQVSWVDANEFCRRLSGFSEEKTAGFRYRLPTEAEWEYACRAGTTTRYSFGASDSRGNRYGWSKANSDNQTHEVGLKQPNPWGLYDMHGNVWEWCQDWHGEYSRSDVTDPKGPAEGSLKVVRGGSWFNPIGFSQSASRGRSTPDRRVNNHGFRVVRELIDEPIE